MPFTSSQVGNIIIYFSGYDIFYILVEDSTGGYLAEWDYSGQVDETSSDFIVTKEAYASNPTILVYRTDWGQTLNPNVPAELAQIPEAVIAANPFAEPETDTGDGEQAPETAYEDYLLKDVPGGIYVRAHSQVATGATADTVTQNAGAILPASNIPLVLPPGAMDAIPELTLSSDGQKIDVSGDLPATARVQALIPLRADDHGKKNPPSITPGTTPGANTPDGSSLGGYVDVFVVRRRGAVDETLATYAANLSAAEGYFGFVPFDISGVALAAGDELRLSVAAQAETTSSPGGTGDIYSSRIVVDAAAGFFVVSEYNTSIAAAIARIGTADNLLPAEIILPASDAAHIVPLEIPFRMGDYKQFVLEIRRTVNPGTPFQRSFHNLSSFVFRDFINIYQSATPFDIDPDAVESEPDFPPENFVSIHNLGGQATIQREVNEATRIDPDHTSFSFTPLLNQAGQVVAFRFDDVRALGLELAITQIYGIR